MLRIRLIVFTLVVGVAAVHITRSEVFQRRAMQGTVNRAAEAVSTALWNLDRVSPRAYLDQALRHSHYQRLSILHPDGREFLTLETEEPFRAADRVLGSLGLMPRLGLAAPVLHGHEQIGRVEVEVRLRSIYDHGATAGIALLLLLVAELFLRLVETNRVLDTRVQARTAELGESEARYRLLADNATDVIWTMDLDLNYTYISPSVTRQRGFTVAEAMAMSPRDSAAPASAAAALAVFAKDLAAASAGNLETPRRTLELEVLRKDGTTFWAEISTSVLRDEAGDVHAVMGVTRDIDARKRAERALQESEACYHTLFESAVDGILLMDRDRIVDCNPRALELFRCPREDLVGRTPQEFSPATQPNGMPSALMAREKTEAALAGRPQVFEWLHRLEDGHEFQVSVTLNRMQLGDRTLVIADVRDITDQVHLEIQLAQAQKMEAIGTLAGGIAHDFNNILSAMMGFTELALLDLGDPALAESDLHKVLKASERARDLVAQILAFSRQGAQEAQPVEVKLVAKEVLKLLRASLPATIEMDIRLESDALTLMDPTRVHQILMNLCTNAGHAMREDGGVLGVVLEAVDLGAASVAPHPGAVPGPHLRLEVSDTGHGMTPEVRERVFEPFFTTKKQGEGTGMGLSVVHGILQEAGGFADVESTPGEGTRFQVFFPVVEPAAPPTESSDRAVPSPRGEERILFVDDEESQCELAVHGLERLGYRVSAFTSSRAALCRFEQSPDAFDVLVSDMTMPEMPGDVLAKRVLLVRPELPILLCTGFSERVDEGVAKAMGVRAFAYKPIVFRELAAKIREMLDGGGAGTQADNRQPC